MTHRLASKIVTAYLRANPVTVAELPSLINKVAEALASVGEKQEEPQAQAPAVPVRKSVRHDAVTCLICGKEGQSLKRHLSVAHDLTPASYRTMFNLPSDHPIVAPEYAERRSNLARSSGLGKKHDEETDPKAKGYRYPASRWAKPS